MSTQEAYALWCRGMFASLSEGGVWGVPRSGLVFTRRGNELVLIERMPWTDDLAEAWGEGRDVPKDGASLRAYQDDDFNTIREQFEAAGITVTNELQNR